MGQRREIGTEVEGLWRAVFGHAPDASLPPEAMLDTLFQNLPEPPPHTTLRRYGTIPPPERR